MAERVQSTLRMTDNLLMEHYKWKGLWMDWTGPYVLAVLP